MSKNPYRDKKLQKEILRYLDSFPNGCVKYKVFIEYFTAVNENILGFNLNELQNDFGFIQLPSSADHSIYITIQGKAENNPKQNFFVSHWKWIVNTIISIIGRYLAF